MHLHDRAWDSFLRHHGFSLTDQEKKTVIHGKANHEIFHLLFNRHIEGDELQTFSEEKEAAYRQLVIETGILMAPGCESFLDLCVSKGIVLGIATSSYRENTKFFIEHFHLEKWFQVPHVVFNDGIMKSKPDPEIFLRTLLLLNADPSSTIIFEDSPAGILAAERSKVGKVVVVLSGAVESVSNKHTVISSFEEAQTLFNGEKT